MHPVIVLPGIVTGFARARDGIGFPGLLPGVRIVSSDVASYSEFSATNTNDNFVFHCQGRHSNGISECHVTHFSIPQYFTVYPIERNQPSIKGTHKHSITENCDTPIIRTATHTGSLIRRMRVFPEYSASYCVNRHNAVWTLSHIHDAVNHNRVRLPRAEHLILQHPLELEIPHIVLLDLIK